MAARPLASGRAACSPTSATTGTSGRSVSNRCSEGGWVNSRASRAPIYTVRLSQRSRISSALSAAGSAAVTGRILARRSVWRPIRDTAEYTANMVLITRICGGRRFSSTAASTRTTPATRPGCALANRCRIGAPRLAPTRTAGAPVVRGGQHRREIVGHALKGPGVRVVVTATAAGPIVGEGAGFIGDESLHGRPHRRAYGDAAFEDDQRVAAARHHGAHCSAVRQSYLLALQPRPGVEHTVPITLPPQMHT